ncbi:MAG: hypothetical protein H6737_19305 [Alphaproteobacteria bacterium]|nr:hypothetical protein [Alphaproteobacteria bacterium]
MLVLALLACGGSTGTDPAKPAAAQGPTKTLSLGPITAQVPEAWSVEAQVARIPASSGRCTVQRLPRNAARDFAAVKRSADRLVTNPPDGVQTQVEERPLGELPGVQVSMKNTKMQGDWRSVQRMIVAAEACVVTIQCSGSPFPKFEQDFIAVLDSVAVDPAGCATPGE